MSKSYRINKPLHELSGTEAAQAIADKSVSSVELVQACLNRIHQQDSVLGAWIHLDEDLALKQARFCDRTQSVGPLHGVPVGIKDIYDTRDMPTAYGSTIYEGYRPVWDSACVSLLRSAGAVIMGKTVTTEFAWRKAGKTTNPHNSAHTPGGSSSGSAAAVADCMTPLATGSQTGGSIIRPASYCGVVGYKPTFGNVPMSGVKPLSHSLDTLGCFSRCVEDAALFRSAMLGTAPTLSAWNNPPVVGICHGPDWEKSGPETVDALSNAVEKLTDAGAEFRETNLPREFDGLSKAHNIIMVYEAWRCLQFEIREHQAQLSEILKSHYGPGQPIQYEEYSQSLALAARCRLMIREEFKKCDVLLTPSTPGEATQGLTHTGDSVFNRTWTLLHLPALSLPCHVSPSGLPVGVQAVGPHGDDGNLLSIAAWMFSVLNR